MSDWPDEVTARIADEIKRLRGPRSGQWLSDQTAERGHRVSRSTISEIETKRRKSITVSDLIVLAAALDTTPIALIYPPPYDAGIRIIPNMVNDAAKMLAVQWFCGLLTENETRNLIGGDLETLSKNRLPIRIAREMYDLESDLHELMRQDVPEDSEEHVQALKGISALRSKIAALKTMSEVMERHRGG